MKKTLFIALALLVAGILPAQKAPTVKLISSNENSVVVNVQLNGYNTNKVLTPFGDQFVVNVPDMAAMLEAGSPNLPTLPVPVLIGDRAEMNVKVTDAHYTDYQGIDIAPSKGNFSRQINPDDVPYTYGEMYNQDAFWPAAQAFLDAPYILRDFRGQNLMIRPFAYNPVSHTLRVYDNLTVEMVKVSDNGENPKATRRSNAVKTSPEYKASYGRRFINFEAAASKYPFLEDAGEMLVICADQFMAGMQPFVDWKNESGRPTTMVSVSEVGGNNIDAIKSYISNLYNNPDHNLAYVLLVGDFEHITPHSFYYDYANQYGDIWLGQLEGNDSYPEVFVGRFSVQTDAHVANHVNKVLYYERDMPEGLTWSNKGLGIGAIGAGSGHFGEDDYQHIDLIRDTLEHYTYEHVTELHGGGGANPTSISNTINAGVSIINYCNHGSETSWGVANYSTSHVNALTNDNMWPIVWSVACLNGKFNYGSECFAEAWMRASNNSTGAPTGAIGGMFSWISQPWQPPMYGQDEMVNILTEWHGGDQYNHTLAGASLNGNMDVIDKGNHVATHDSWILFGDPSLMVRTDNPVEMEVSANPSVLMLGMSELVVNADTEYGIATLSMNGEVIASARVIDGTATLTFPGLSDVGNATLTVIGFNKVTYRGEVEIVPAEGPYLVLDNYEVATNNGSVLYGEESTVNIGVKNVGVEAVGNVNVTVTTESEYVELVNNTFVINNIEANEIANIEDEIRFNVANNTPDGTKIVFHLDLTAGDYAWESNFNVTVNAPVLVMCFAGTEGELAPGTQGTLELRFRNEGHALAPTKTVNVFSSSTDIVLENTAFEVSELNVLDSLTVFVPFTIAETVEIGSCYEISYLLNADYYTIDGATAISIGEVTDGFETGDFSSFEWTFEGPQNWVIDNTNAHEGTYCAKSGAIGDNQTTKLVLNVLIPRDSEISFWRKTSSEGNYDKLFFKIDGNEQGNWSGNTSWNKETYTVTAGQHTLSWEYTKDYSYASGQDCVWIDDVTLPATHVQNSTDPVAELVATVEDNEVSLSWLTNGRNATYIIYRDGVEVSTQEDAEYAESVEHGTYTYSVVAMDDNGNVSAPAFVTVDVRSYLEVSENTTMSGKVFPNPTHGVLNLDFQGSYTYSIFNRLGQQVATGKAQGQHQLNLEGLAKGIYLLRISNGELVNTHKVIVK